MLTLVPTPIGNLEDITLRALRALREADLIACEDTRTSGVLLSHHGIETPTLSYHDHNERRRAPELIQRMKEGGRVALITDAGTPGISDPAFFLVRACVEAEIELQALPGPTAFVPALVASGLPCERFAFEGFLPAKKGRKTRLESLGAEPRTLVFYESPHRLVRTLRDLERALGNREAVVARELTKKFETYYRDRLGALADRFEAGRVRGECVIVVAPPDRVARKKTREAAEPEATEAR